MAETRRYHTSWLAVFSLIRMNFLSLDAGYHLEHRHLHTSKNLVLGSVSTIPVPDFFPFRAQSTDRISAKKLTKFRSQKMKQLKTDHHTQIRHVNVFLLSFSF